MAERRAQQIVEADLLAQPQDLVADLIGCAVQDHLIEVALDRVDANGREASLHNRPVLRTEIGIDDPFGATARYLRCLADVVGNRHQTGDRDIAAGLRETGSRQFRRVVTAFDADLGT